jgi:membrane protein DedA with SNARE-associated domain
MPEEVVNYIMRYGYLAIFVLVFLQETGMPNPFPNELLLIFSGYLSSNGVLFLPLIILTVVSADFIGTNMLYTVFYKTGSYIMIKKPKWIPCSSGLIEKLTHKINRGGKLSIFILRLTPFTRGYASVIAGLLQIKPRVFLPIAFLSAISWASVYVVAGYLIGPFWNAFIQNLEGFKYIMVGFLLLGCLVLLVAYISKRKVNNINRGMTDSLSE